MGLRKITFEEAGIGDLIYVRKGSSRPWRVVRKTQQKITLEESGEIPCQWTYHDSEFDLRMPFLLKG